MRWERMPLVAGVDDGKAAWRMVEEACMDLMDLSDAMRSVYPMCNPL